MGKVKWYKRDPNAALTGMMALTLEERGAYNTVLDLIYTHDGSLDDDERFICGWLRCDVRVWKRIRQRLLDLEKLYLVGGKLRNARADTEVDAAQHRINRSAQAGLASAAKREADRKIINGLASTSVQRMPQPSTSTKKERIFLPSMDAARVRDSPANGAPQPTSEQAEAPQGLQDGGRRPPHVVSRAELEARFEERRKGKG